MLEELQSIADSLAGRLARSVTIGDLQFRSLVHTPHLNERIDGHRVQAIMQKCAGEVLSEWLRGHRLNEAMTPVFIPANDELDALPRVCVPVRRHGVLLAYLWLLDSGKPLSDSDLAKAIDSAVAAGEVLYQSRLTSPLSRSRMEDLLGHLLGAETSMRKYAARQLAEAVGLRDESAASAIVIALQIPSAVEDECLEAIERALQRAATRLTRLDAWWSTGGGTVGVLLLSGNPLPHSHQLSVICEEVRADVLRAGHPTVVVRVGIGPAVESLDLAVDSYERALDVLHVATRVPGFGTTTAWHDLGVYQLLLRFPLEEIHSGALPSSLSRLAETDDSGVLTETAEVYLDVAGRAQAAVELLNVHRTSLYYRLARVEEITGLNLKNGVDRLALHLGVKLMRLGQAPTDQS